MTDEDTAAVEGPENLKSLYTKRAINGVGLAIEEMISTTKDDIHVRKGIVAGMSAAAPLTAKVMAQVMAEVDSGKMDGEQAKVIMGWLQKCREEIEKAASLNQKELAVKEGIIEGFRKSVEKCETLFKQEEMKQRVREIEADRGNRDEGGRPLPIREVRGESPAPSDAPEPAVVKKRGRRAKVQ